MRRSTIPEARVPLRRQNVGDRNTSESDNLSESQEGTERDIVPENSWEAWTCLTGSFFMMFPSFGFQTAGKCPQLPSPSAILKLILLSRICSRLYQHASTL